MKRHSFFDLDMKRHALLLLLPWLEKGTLRVQLGQVCVSLGEEEAMRESFPLEYPPHTELQFSLSPDNVVVSSFCPRQIY